MLGLLTGFIDELRAAGLPVSMVEAIDAAAVLDHVNMGDREAFKSALGATLVKRARHYEAFEIAFEVYFGLRYLEPIGDEPFTDLISGGAGAGSGGGEVTDEMLIEVLLRAIRTEDQALLRAVVRAAVDHLAGMEPGRPVGGTYYLYRVLRRLQVDQLAERLLAEAVRDTEPTALTRRLLSEEIELRLDQFRAEVRAEIRRRLVADRGHEAVAKTLRRPLVEDIDLLHAGRAELAAVERAVHPLTRKLAVRLARRRKRDRHGRLDIRSTIRRSLSAGGVLMEPRFRSAVPSKPELFVLSDVSGSVATFARFTLQLVFALSHEFSRVRSFAFIDAIDEVTKFFGPGADFAEALRRVGTEAEVVWLDGHSDYGNAFHQFQHRYLGELTPRSVLIVTGDARTNYHDPNVVAFAEAASLARAVYWLNPEAQRYWDTGDSVIDAYAPFCDGVFEVRNLRQLERFVEEVALPRGRLRVAR